MITGNSAKKPLRSPGTHVAAGHSPNAGQREHAAAPAWRKPLLKRGDVGVTLEKTLG
jgi:hypothetical protein